MPSFVELKSDRCWWCGAPADSREHKLKRSDLVREYGKPPYTGLRTLTRFGGDGRRDFRGPGSGLMKFSASLCARCNNQRSQPFDRAWDAFTAYLVENEEMILNELRVDLEAVYGLEWRAQSANLARYVVKHLVCRIIHELEAPVRLDKELLAFLAGGPYPSCLQLDFCLDLGVVEMLRLTSSDPAPEDPEAAEAGFLALRPLWVMLDRRTGQWSEPQGGLYYRWLAVYWHVTGPEPDASPFDHSTLTLKPSDELFGSEVREAFSALVGVPSGLLEGRDPATFPDVLREAGYDEAADRLARLRQDYGRSEDAE
jgi:hypothetical protein